MRGFATIALLGLAAAGGGARADGNAEQGRAVFRLCASCHEVGPSARAGFGPQLDGIVGRRAAATPDFKYSDALRRSNIVWSDASLAAFLRDPQRAVPGTKMRFRGLDDDRKLADLLAYLRTFPAR